MEENAKPKPWYKKRSLVFLRDAIIILVVFWGISHWQTREMLQADGSVQIDAEALVGLDGQVHDIFLPNDEGKPTLVYFFAPWCTVCKFSIGNLEDLNPQKVNVVRIALDYTSKESVENFVIDTKTSGVVLFGNNDIKQRFKVPGYPSYYLLDAQQRIVGSAMGYSTEWGMKLKTYLAQK